MGSGSWVRICSTCGTANGNPNEQQPDSFRDILRKAAPDKEAMIDELDRVMKKEA